MSDRLPAAARLAHSIAAGWTQRGNKPNIVIIWGDDIGQSDISAYSHGLMGFKTPNIDRIAKEGMMFTNYYREQSCTAGLHPLHVKNLTAFFGPGRLRWRRRKICGFSGFMAALS